MVTSMKKIVFFSLLILVHTSFARSREEDIASKNLSDLKRKISFQSKNLKSLRSQISKLESSLGESNKKYIETLEEKKQIEIALYDARHRLTESQEALSENLEKTKGSLRAVVLGNLDDVETSSDLLSKKILTQLMQKKIEKIKSEIAQGKQLEKSITSLTERYQEFLRTESDLKLILDDLENKKSAVAEKYVEEEKEKDQLQVRFDQLKSKVYISHQRRKAQRSVKQELSFMSPLDAYVGIKHQKKGITFKFKGQKPVKSAEGGKVVHIGALSNYGNVVIVDHGNQTRSIYFGQFSPKVKKNTDVKKGQLLGYTKSIYGSRQAGNIYFEVRKKDKAQNTVLLMDDKFLTKNKLAKN